MVNTAKPTKRAVNYEACACTYCTVKCMVGTTLGPKARPLFFRQGLMEDLASTSSILHTLLVSTLRYSSSVAHPPTRSRLNHHGPLTYPVTLYFSASSDALSFPSSRPITSNSEV